MNSNHKLNASNQNFKLGFDHRRVVYPEKEPSTVQEQKTTKPNEVEEMPKREA